MCSIGWFALQAIPKKTLQDLKRSFMEEYDANNDGKIEIKEVCNCNHGCPNQKQG